MLIISFSALGTITLSLFFYLLHKSQLKFDTPLLGLFTLGIALLAVAIFNPNQIKLSDGTTLSRIQTEVHTIKESLRPFAVVDVHTEEVIRSTYPNNSFQFVSMKEEVYHDEKKLIVRFRLKAKATFVEARSTEGYGIKIDQSPQVQNDWYEYIGEYIGGMVLDDKTGRFVDQIIFEAYFSPAN